MPKRMIGDINRDDGSYFISHHNYHVNNSAVHQYCEKIRAIHAQSPDSRTAFLTFCDVWVLSKMNAADGATNFFAEMAQQQTMVDYGKNPNHDVIEEDIALLCFALMKPIKREDPFSAFKIRAIIEISRYNTLVP
jgi:hypothetical protein